MSSIVSCGTFRITSMRASAIVIRIRTLGGHLGWLIDFIAQQYQIVQVFQVFEFVDLSPVFYFVVTDVQGLQYYASAQTIETVDCVVAQPQLLQCGTDFV